MTASFLHPTSEPRSFQPGVLDHTSLSEHMKDGSCLQTTPRTWGCSCPNLPVQNRARPQRHPRQESARSPLESLWASARRRMFSAAFCAPSMNFLDGTSSAPNLVDTGPSKQSDRCCQSNLRFASAEPCQLLSPGQDLCAESPSSAAGPIGVMPVDTIRHLSLKYTVLMGECEMSAEKLWKKDLY